MPAMDPPPGVLDALADALKHNNSGPDGLHRPLSDAQAHREARAAWRDLAAAGGFPLLARRWGLQFILQEMDGQVVLFCEVWNDRHWQTVKQVPCPGLSLE